MPLQWSAVEAETDLLRRARELQRSWERLLADGALGPELPPRATAGLRPTIVESWQRSLATGLDPTDVLAPVEADESEVLERWFEHPLGSLTHLLTELLQQVAEESRSMVVVTDASGLVLQRLGDERLKERALVDMNLVEGARYSEEADGTNGIGTALAGDHAFQVFAFEHFNERHHEWICSGAPVHDPVSGKTIGLIDLSSLWKIAHPRSLELVTTAARTMEQSLLDARRDRDARLLRRYSDLASRSTDLLVDGDGYVLTGDEPTRRGPLDIPEGGGEIVLDAGSIAVAEPLGQGEAYLVRRLTPLRARAAPVQALERAEERAREVASEQAALRQVATLVARESSPGRLFAVVAEQVAQVFDVPLVRLVRYEPDGMAVVGAFSEGDDEPFPIGSRLALDTPGVAATVRETGRPARVEDWAQMPGQIADVVRGAGLRSVVGSPIVVEGSLWGVMLVLSPRHGPLAEDTEARLTDFTELVATAIANAESHVAVARLADEQAALLRVATLVAEDVPAGDLFDAVTREVGTFLGGDFAGMARFEGDTVVTVGVWAADGEHPAVPHRWKMQPGDPATTVAETRGAARWTDWTGVPGPIAEFIRDIGIRSTVGTPIIVGGRVWGALALHSKQSTPLAPDTESRMAKFTDLVGTAIANSEARAEVARLADEQAALRRVATLVARGAPREEVFTGIASEIGHLFGLEETRMVRYHDDGTGVVVARSGPNEDFFAVGTRVSVETDTAASRVFRTGEPVRIDDYGTGRGGVAEAVRSMGIRGVVATPISVEGRLWGAITAGTTQDEPLPPETEARLGQLSELLATAVANTESRAEVERLAEEQAALRRVATLVAEGSSPSAVLDAVAAEMERVLGADATMLLRYEPDEEVTVVARRVPNLRTLAPGTRVSHEGHSVTAMVRRTGRPARIGNYQRAQGPIADLARAASWNLGSAVGAPIVVDGRLWGVIIASWAGEQSPPADTEERMAKFAELLDTAIANADSRDQLTASRARLLTAGDEARRRVVRDLHDGAQQRLVHTIVTLKLAQRAAQEDDGEVESLLGEALELAEQGNRELRDLAHGILPAALTRGGLRAGVDALVARLDLPVAIDVPGERLPAELEASTYFIVAEGLTNVTKHAHATRADVRALVDDGLLRVVVRDNGIGGADASGNGLVGMADRVSALGGSLSVESPAGEGTVVTATLPLTAA